MTKLRVEINVGLLVYQEMTRYQVIDKILPVAGRMIGDILHPN
jgi:hypothetical protein